MAPPAEPQPFRDTLTRAWATAVQTESLAELGRLPTRRHRRRRDKLAARLLARGERLRREMLS